MSNVLRIGLACLVGTMFLSTAYGQNDGECTIPFNTARFADVIAAVGEDFPLADYGLSAPLVTTAPVADGKIGAGEYPNTCFFSFADRQNPGNPFPALDTIDDTGDADVSLRLHLAHTDEFLFLGFEVTDEFLDLDEGANAFTNDSIELFINADLAIDDFNPDTVGRNSGLEGFQIVADAAGGGNVEFNNRFSAGAEPIPIAPSEGPPSGGEYLSAGLPSATGHIVEYQLPLASLDTESDDNFTVRPAKTGDVMLMNAVVNDNDFEGAGGQDTHAMLWVVEDDPRSPFGGGENIWVIPLELSVAEGKRGDFDGDGDRDIDDVNSLITNITPGPPDPAKFDLTNDGQVNQADLTFWAKDPSVKNTWLGDSNLDGAFDTADLVLIFQRGKFEQNVAAGWNDGDWTGDARFGTGDLVAAFQDGGFEKGPRPGGVGVPEPAACTLGFAGLIAIGLLGRARRRT